MPSLKLTAHAVQNAKAPPKGRREYWDTLAPGLALRVTDKGAKSWIVMYRLHGKQRRLTIGDYPAYSLADAREEARIVIFKVKKKIDPIQEKKEAARLARIEPPPAADTVREAAEEFIERYAKPKNRSWQQTDRIFKTYIYPEWGNRELQSIIRRDILDLLDDIVAKGQHALANKIFAHLRTFIHWSIEREKITSSPIAAMKAPAKVISRDRVLTDAEIVLLWKCWEQMAWPFGTAFQLMLLTGQRRSEVASMRWADVDLKAKVWTLPRENTKSNRLNEVPLSTFAVNLVKNTPQTGTYLFSTTGSTPISGFSKAKRDCDDLALEALQKHDKKAKLAPWRLHDLRRTLSTNMARLGIAEHVVERIINHATGTSKGVAGVYNRHAYTDEKRQALQIWSNYVEDFLGRKPDKVLTMKRAQHGR